jgi:uncharacterized protein YkwD
VGKENMFRVPATWLALVLMSGSAPVKVQNSAKVLPVSSPTPQLSSGDSSPYDSADERALLDLANQARAQAGLRPLQMDDGLTQAARAHAAAMAAQQQLSHELPGEPSLAQRLAANCTLHLDRAGENVSFAGSVDQAEESLMHSPPHRENLLNPGYNVAGFGVVRSGFSLYIAQDFGHSLPAYSPRQASDIVSGSVARARREANLVQLRWIDNENSNGNGTASTAACAMAKSDSLNAPAQSGRHILRYTTMQPELLPDGAVAAIADRNAQGFTVGTCFARTPTYPSGVYWVDLILY